MNGFWSGVAGAALVCVPVQVLAAESPRFQWPIDCTPGETCNIQNYVDRDPGMGAKDFRCGHLTYNGHKGTDIRIRDLGMMRRGVSVRAAAAGRVIGSRNNMPDVNVKKIGVKALKGQDCGNGARIDHGEGWITQYCHMRRGSMRVKPGDQVKVGQVLGLVGLSGRTEFPHLHFQVQNRGKLVDPFVGVTDKTGCSVKERPLWRDMQTIGLGYRSVGLIDAGFMGRPPNLEIIEEGNARGEMLPAGSAALVFWVKLFGVRPEDQQRLTVYRPDGAVLLDIRPKPVNRPKAQSMAYAGKRPPRGEKGYKPWPPGSYRGVYSLVRNGRTVVETERKVRVE